jgi:DNA-binding XRE family transcriptional regulator
MFEVAKAAKLQPSDLAKLLKVNRITVSMWYNGHSNPHRLLHEQVRNLLDRIDTAVQSGALPVPRDVSRRERSHYIQQALAGPQDSTQIN